MQTWNSKYQNMWETYGNIISAILETPFGIFFGRWYILSLPGISGRAKGFLLGPEHDPVNIPTSHPQVASGSIANLPPGNHRTWAFISGNFWPCEKSWPI
jgi:hypothetical protein